jgi:hypothetical protein
MPRLLKARDVVSAKSSLIPGVAPLAKMPFRISSILLRTSNAIL